MTRSRNSFYTVSLVILLATITLFSANSEASEAPKQSFPQLCVLWFQRIARGARPPKTAIPPDVLPQKVIASTVMQAQDLRQQPIAVLSPPVQAPSISRSVRRLEKEKGRKMAALDELVVRRLITKDQADDILSSGDIEKLSSLNLKGRITDAELAKLQSLFSKAEMGDVPRKNPINSSAQSSVPRARPSAESPASLEKYGANQSATQKVSIDSLLHDPATLRGGVMIELPSASMAFSGKPLRMTFDDRALDEISAAERSVVQKFVSSIRVGVSGEALDKSKIRILSALKTGSRGRPFEIRIVQRGHPRILGCFKDGLYTVLRYDSHAPEQIDAFKLKYSGLCD